MKLPKVSGKELNEQELRVWETAYAALFAQLSAGELRTWPVSDRARYSHAIANEAVIGLRSLRDVDRC